MSSALENLRYALDQAQAEIEEARRMLDAVERAEVDPLTLATRIVTLLNKEKANG